MPSVWLQLSGPIVWPMICQSRPRSSLRQSLCCSRLLRCELCVFQSVSVAIAGAAVVAAWIAATAVSYIFGTEMTVTQSYESYLATHALLIGAEVERLIALTVVVGAIAVGAKRARSVVTVIDNARDELVHLAHYDTLTSLPNRTHLRLALAKALSGREINNDVALFCLDLDHFKRINDTLGHDVGDRLLHAVAAALKSAVRRTDLVARVGGDGFAVLTSGHKDTLDTNAIAQRIIVALSEPFDVGGNQLDVGTTIGIARASAFDHANVEEFIKSADLALYRAKKECRSSYLHFEQRMDDQMQTKRQLEVRLRHAVANNELEVFYQPLIDIKAERVCAFEALVRWRDGSGAFVSPADFIPLAEEIGLINDIGAYVLQRATSDANSWPDQIGVAINLSAIQLRNSDFVSQVKTALLTSGLRAERLELEITETTIMADTAENSAVLNELQALGIRVAMDDFGTGYSSLSYLQKFPLDKIKVDRSFMNRLEKDVQSRALLKAIIALGNELDMTTTAEGIETSAQLAILNEMGCNQGQGFYFSPAVSADKVPNIIQDLNTRQHRRLRTVA